MTRRLLCLLAVLSVLLGGCYHLRLLPEPLGEESVEVPYPPSEAEQFTVSVLKQEGFFVRREEHATLVTGFRHFLTETGSGHPAEGRHAYYRLKVTLRPSERGGTVVTLMPAGLELRTTYVYDEEGKVQTLSKRYPYDEYPGMFDLEALRSELARLKVHLGEALEGT